MIGKSNKLHAAEEDALLQISQQIADISEPLPVTYPMHVRFLFYRGDRRAVDLSNLYEFPQDILQSAGIIANDALIESHDGSRKRYDKEHPRTEIYIEHFDGQGSAVPTPETKETHTMAPWPEQAPQPAELPSQPLEQRAVPAAVQP